MAATVFSPLGCGEKAQGCSKDGGSEELAHDTNRKCYQTCFVHPNESSCSSKNSKFAQTVFVGMSRQGTRHTAQKLGSQQPTSTWKGSVTSQTSHRRKKVHFQEVVAGTVRNKSCTFVHTHLNPLTNTDTHTQRDHR